MQSKVTACRWISVLSDQTTQALKKLCSSLKALKAAAKTERTATRTRLSRVPYETR